MFFLVYFYYSCIFILVFALYILYAVAGTQIKELK
jgi:hypothetical protein